MNQYVPDVSESDIERVLRRDYAVEHHAAIREMIASIEMREKTRVVLACLKNGKGNLTRLQGELANADGWWREIISEAEYPHYSKKRFRIDRISPDEQQRIIEKDKAQYLQWLSSERAHDKGSDSDA
ncbi:MAG TPA: hypothetical protein VLF42_06520 [Burkholderiales bacterium]|nr:hypothetical protein [Burkholderiales bacterium]